MTRHAALAVLLLAAVSAPALADDCRHSAPRSLELDFSGVRTVMFDVGPHTLRVDAGSSPKARIEGRACASDEARLEALTLDARRDGDKLVVRLGHDSAWSGLSLGNRYAYMTLDAGVPANVLVQLQVGSGDARVTGAASASADVGSGDVELLRTSGRVTAKVGSGDVEVDDAGALHVLSIGSGDLEAANVRGETQVGSIGSGDFTLRGAGGDVQIDSIGSGDAELERVQGNVRIGSIGSGDVDMVDVTGNLAVRSKGSGSVHHSRVAGTVDLPRQR